MRFFILMKKHVIILLVFLISISLFFIYIIHEYTVNNNDLYQAFMGYSEYMIDNQIKNDIEYFRPSKLPILNDKEFKTDFMNKYNLKESSEIILPQSLLENPYDNLINFFSILRQAANYVKGKVTGCGTLGYSKLPYPTAYEFLSSDYQEKLSYEEFLALFENILHLNLIKLHEVIQDERCSDGLRYFIEFETIEGSEKGVGYFAYYYGYICLIKVDDVYKISDISFQGEDYLCAPYHGWNYIGEAVVDIKYGNWCSLVEERYETQQDDYIKNIYFKGTDGFDYRILFFQLTNGKDVEIAQYRKKKNNEWEVIKLDPEKCLENNNKD
ncbi:hypothetical protein SH1V18_33840 [Vallitalea longa]|uniref:Uncharacterized protein n=1 Tax=Vallitalea longa TaxID=2936439 RepID=A0A9W6DHI8_9FIRM|nr:hypothetical protein [Vallitalea longa]GKX30904.1 hypothetical protein SH1V18_33840 [Vallitalea longa]